MTARPSIARGRAAACPRTSFAPRSGAGEGGRGFTLLEVMISLGILAASLVAISEIAGGALRNQVRARQLQVATLLARTKMVQVQAEAERKGFRDFDETEEGTFEKEGHPEVRWKVEVRKPAVELGPKAVLSALTGGKSLEELLPSPESAPQLAPYQAVMQATLSNLLTQIGERLKKSVREVRLTVSWADGRSVESFDVVTHLVVVEPEER